MAKQPRRFTSARTAAGRKENGLDDAPTAANLTASSKKDFARRRKRRQNFSGDGRRKNQLKLFS
jgi:hypothetical protein